MANAVVSFGEWKGCTSQEIIENYIRCARGAHRLSADSQQTNGLHGKVLRLILRGAAAGREGPARHARAQAEVHGARDGGPTVRKATPTVALGHQQFVLDSPVQNP